MAAGYPVPPFIVVTTAALRAMIGEASVDRDEIDALPIPPGLHDQLTDALATAGLGDGPFAVRSSAVGEDGADLSYAGQFESLLFVPRDELIDAIRHVWRSAYAPRVAEYRRMHGVDAALPGVAVIVQRMIDADRSGVAFGVDPVGGARDAVVVSAVWGLGEGLVSGLLDADTYTITPDGTEARIARKDEMIAVDRERGGHTVRRPVAAELREAPALDDAMLDRIATMTRDLGRTFGRPQDVEWCVAGDTLHLLQSRPVTGLGALPPDPNGHRILWDNANIIESYAGVTTPLTFSFVGDVYTEVYREFCRILGVDEETIERNGAAFQMLGMIKGRIYYNLLNWYRMLALLPGYSINAAFMEQMMGVTERLEETPSIIPSRRNPWLRLGGSVARLLTTLARLRGEIARFQRHLDATLAPYEGSDLRGLAPHELIETYRLLERELLRRWRVPILNDFYTMIFFGLLKKSIASRGIDPAGTLHNDLLSGEGGVISTEPPRALRAIADEIRKHPDLAASFVDDAPSAAMRALSDYPAVADLVRAYLARFGSRYPGELKLETITPAERPELVVAMIAGFLRQTEVANDEGVDRAAAIRESAEERVRRAIRAPHRRVLFNYLLRQARERVRNRENLRFERTRVFAVVRTIFTALGERFHAEGIIDDPRDVFHLTKEEIFSWVDGTAVSVDLRGLVALRRVEHARDAAEPPPGDRFETRGMVYQGNTFRSAVARVAPEDGSLSGIPCGGGVVRAVARRVVDPGAAPSLEGCILVAERTDPGWVPLFVAAKGILVERGSLLSHSAIVAREMGIPAVVGIPGLMEWIVDGEILEMDGASGVVRRVSEEP